MDGILYSKFRQVKGNPQFEGISLAAPEGTPVLAAEDGVVGYAAPYGSLGPVILIRHANGYVTAYSRIKDLSVREGDRVKRGDTIARLGGPTEVSGPFLRFEVRQDRNPVDPLLFLPR